MTRIYVQATVRLAIDVEDLIRLGVTEEWWAQDEISLEDHLGLAHQIIDIEEERIIPRWARSAMKLTDTDITIEDHR